MEAPAPRIKGHKSLWEIEDRIPAEIHKQLNGRSVMLSHLLYCRGYRTPQEIEEFFQQPTISHDPFLLPDMNEAVSRIERAVEANEKVAVYGDFDCDGITSAVLMMSVFEDLGLDVVSHIPSREDGHGLHPEALKALAEQGVRLVISADCGISAVEEVQTAIGLGMDVIITDHHEPRSDGSLPAVPTVAPTRLDSSYPWRSLCGVGVSYKVAQALRQRLDSAPDPDRLLDLVALGTVADVVPLQDENRSLVLRGLEALRTSQRPGLLALFEAAGIQASRIDPVSVGYYLAPRLNAANRMASPQLAYDLLTAADRKSAAPLAQQLSDLNEQRQALVDDTFTELLERIGSAADISQQVQEGARCPVLLIVGEWPPGISGLLASKLVEAYGLPAFVGSAQGDGTISVSARSVAGVHIDQILEACNGVEPDGLFKGFGGHSAAGGFRIDEERLPVAERALEEESRRVMDVGELGRVIAVDAEVDLGQLNLASAQMIRSLAPFGRGFPEPLFLARRVSLRSRIERGAGKHVKVVFQKGNHRIGGMYFSADPEFTELQLGTVVDAVFQFQLGEWNGFLTPEICLQDWRLSD